MIVIEMQDPHFAHLVAHAAENYSLTILDNATCEQTVEDSMMLSAFARCLYDVANKLATAQSTDE